MSSYSVIKAAIKSSSFGNYLSINGANMASAVDLGAGSATTTKTIDATSTLYIEVYTNGIYAIRVPSTPGAYLRFDARDIAASKAATDNGAGVVNCQYYKTGFSGPQNYESFRLRSLPDGTCGLESVVFPGCFLRIAGTTVNGNWYNAGSLPGAGNYEQFSILLLN